MGGEPTSFGHALVEGIPCVPIVAATDGRVVGAATAGVVATCPRTRIFAALIDTGPVRGTLGTGHALGLAVGRSAHVVWQAGADGTIPSHVASAEQATRRGSTGVKRQGQIHI